MRVFGIWHGGSSYAHGGSDDVEMFTSMSDAMNEFRNRAEHGRGTFAYVNRPECITGTPAVDRTTAEHGGPTLWLYFRNPTGERDAYPDRVVEYGTRGGIVVTEA